MDMVYGVVEGYSTGTTDVMVGLKVGTAYVEVVFA